MSDFEQKPKFDFNSVASFNDSNLNDFLMEKEQYIKQKLSKTKQQKPKNTFAWFFVFILLASLIALGTLTLTESKKNKDLLAKLEEKSQVLGANDITVSPISGYGFSILPDSTPPSEFKSARKNQNSPVLEGRKEVISSFLASFSKNNQQILSGIEVSVIEYDNKYNQEQFTDLVIKYLGEDYEVKSKDILLPKNVKAWKIEKKGRAEYIQYFTAVTMDNYYLIKIYNETSKHTQYNEISKFTDTILQKLYLN